MSNKSEENQIPWGWIAFGVLLLFIVFPRNSDEDSNNKGVDTGSRGTITELKIPTAQTNKSQSQPIQSGCPQRCTTHKTGCDIKGNVSFDSGEKIYHVPGQEYYADTWIDPTYGKRWFCTEQEAINNGWRKSYK